MEDPIFDILFRQLLLRKKSDVILHYSLAVARFQSLKKRWLKILNFYRRCTDQIDSNILMGHVEKVPFQNFFHDKTVYMPYCPILTSPPPPPQKKKFPIECDYAAASCNEK